MIRYVASGKSGQKFSSKFNLVTFTKIEFKSYQIFRLFAKDSICLAWVTFHHFWGSWLELKIKLSNQVKPSQDT